MTRARLLLPALSVSSASVYDPNAEPPRPTRKPGKDAAFTHGQKPPHQGTQDHTYISRLLAAGAKPFFVCRQTGTSLEMVEKHYGDARVDALRFDETMGGLDPSTRNPAGTSSISGEAVLLPKATKLAVLPKVASKAGDRGRTGDVQLGNSFDANSNHNDQTP